ncbi:hypothetical protein [Motiliproteus sp. MSK22-1]|nr:hypothetical protein [Motiliproteus sp. MSK22-1]
MYQNNVIAVVDKNAQLSAMAGTTSTQNMGALGRSRSSVTTSH